MQNDAGVTVSGKLTVNLMAALFDMSAFVLIEGQGKSGVRSMQRYLNGKYSDELGILPCDGIYQREGFLMVFLGLVVITYEDVGGDAAARNDALDVGDALQILLTGVFAVHQLQNLVASALCTRS